MPGDGMPSLTSVWGTAHKLIYRLAWQTPGRQFLTLKPRRDSSSVSVHTSRLSCQPFLPLENKFKWHTPWCRWLSTLLMYWAILIKIIVIIDIEGRVQINICGRLQVNICASGLRTTAQRQGWTSMLSTARPSSLSCLPRPTYWAENTRSTVKYSASPCHRVLRTCGSDESHTSSKMVNNGVWFEEQSSRVVTQSTRDDLGAELLALIWCTGLLLPLSFHLSPIIKHSVSASTVLHTTGHLEHFGSKMSPHCTQESACLRWSRNFPRALSFFV